MQNYLTADNLTVGYRGKPILSDISMNIRRGSIVTLIGPNGAGKSTILKSISRDRSPLAEVYFLTAQPWRITRILILRKRPRWS